MFGIILFTHTHTHNHKSILACAQHKRIRNTCISDLPVSALDREAEHQGVGVGDRGLGVQGAADGRHWPLLLHVPAEQASENHVNFYIGIQVKDHRWCMSL